MLKEFIQMSVYIYFLFSFDFTMNRII